MIGFYKGDSGITITVNFVDSSGDPIDLSTASYVQLTYENPEGTIGYWIPIGDNPTLGQYHYELVPGDIDVSGEWKLQGIYLIGQDYQHTNIQKFIVRDVIPFSFDLVTEDNLEDLMTEDEQEILSEGS